MTLLSPDLPLDGIALAPPAFPGRATLRVALEERRSTRAFRADPIPADLMSGLLWAACGVNRTHAGGRTAPSAHGWHETTLLAVNADGAWCYEPEAHRLALVRSGDLRSLTGLQDFVGSAPLDLVYVVDHARMPGASEEERAFLAAVGAGCIAQNVSLFCAAVGLGTVVRALVDRPRLAGALGLPVTQRILLAQSVGWPEDAPGARRD